MSEPGSAANAAEATCGCCDGFYAATPVEVFNRPGLSAVQYRVGTHPAFKRTMLAILSAEEHSELKALKTRSDDDFAVGRDHTRRSQPFKEFLLVFALGDDPVVQRGRAHDFAQFVKGEIVDVFFFTNHVGAYESFGFLQ